jgi:hypothetical protein
MTYEEEDVVVAAEKLSILTASDASAVMLCTDEDEQYEVSNISFSHRHKVGDIIYCLIVVVNFSKRIVHYRGSNLGNISLE